MKHDKFNLDYFLDFIKCNNDMIFKIIPKKLPIKDYLIPYVKRYTAKKIRNVSFSWTLTERNICSVLATGSSNDKSKNLNRCFSIDLLVMKENTLSIVYVSIE